MPSAWQHKPPEKVILLWARFIVAYVLDLALNSAITATAHLYCAAFLQTLDNRRRLYRSWDGLL
jgi:hypothetical protein